MAVSTLSARSDLRPVQMESVHGHAGPTEPPRAISSETLLQGARRLLIAHGAEVYTLHLTRQNKLLLTK